MGKRYSLNSYESMSAFGRHGVANHANIIDEKAMACADALNDLKEQEREIAKSKLDNVIQHYTNRVTQLDNIVKMNESQMNLAQAMGKEEQSGDYQKSIDATMNKISQLSMEREALAAELKNLISQGLIEVNSDVWFEYNAKLDDLDRTIVETREDIIDLQDAANQVKLTKLGYELDKLSRKETDINDFISLHEAQNNDESNQTYVDLINNGMKQIDILEQQNVEYRKQQEGLDELSEKYQELENNIQSNISAITQMKTQQEKWNDAIVDLKISELEKFKDTLSKTNDQYERRKELQEAIEDLERARSQRTQRVYVEGQGFVYQADQEALKNAQNNLQDVINDQLISRIDDLIDALKETADNTNVYDAQGNLLGSVYNVPQIEDLSTILSNYYTNPNTSSAISGLRNMVYDKIISELDGANMGQNLALQIGDIIVNEANDGNELAEAIVDQFPNALLQAIYKK